MSDNFKYVQAQPFALAGSGAALAATSVILQSMTTIDGVALAMTDFGSIGYGTLEPGAGTQEEQISFTGITQNANGTATLTGVKTVLFIAPYTETSGLAKSHAGGVKFVISNTAGFYNQLTSKSDDETVTGKWTFPGDNTNRPVNGTDVDAVDNTALITFGQLSRTSFAGTVNASTTVKGIVEIATDAELQAGTGTGGTGAVITAAGGSFNQTAAANKVPVAKSNALLDDAWVALTTAGDTLYSNGTDLTRLALGALNTVLKSGASAPAWGTVAPTELTGVSANVTAANLNTLTAGVASVASALHIHGIGFGSGTKTGASGTGTQTVAHGLGVTPRYMFFIAMCPDSFAGAQFARSSFGMTAATTGEVCLAYEIRTTTAVGGGSNPYSSEIIHLEDDGSTARFIADVSALDSTNITLNWSTVPASGTATYIWVAFA